MLQKPHLSVWFFYSFISVKGESAVAGCSKMRLKYIGRLIMRIIMGIMSVLLYVYSREDFAVLDGMEFFTVATPLHVFWLIWMGDMLLQIVPVRGAIAMGSLKQFSKFFVPAAKAAHGELADFRRRSNIVAAKVFALWTAVAIGIGILARRKILAPAELFLLCVFFYVCDLICVVIWCPFRTFIMKNRCCTSCRIFNWDHIMMFIPFAFAGGFFGWSLLLVAVFVFVTWDLAFYLHPERFWVRTNAALHCSRCTDVLCGRKKA